MSQENSTAPPVAPADRKWYSLRVISGKERKIQERILLEIERSNWKDAVFSVVVPTEKVYKIRNGKKVMTERNLLPGYILVEALAGKLNGDIAKMISDIPNVIHFLGKETPLPMTQVEANRLLGKVDESAESGETLSEPFLIGETIRIVDGAFADFVGDVQEVNEEKKKLKVIVKIFGRGTEMELGFMQVEKIS
ncbi:MAG: transcription termination/antitermination protein NusG [Saprospiraceae bacterium]|nr:transcription termination/antitermination protein NusG [Saprospiraceae bacterium]